MLNPVTSSRIKPKIQAIRMAAKKDGNDMPMVVINKVSLLRKLVFNMAVRMPINKPNIKAKEMETTANSKVLGNASPKMLDTLRLL